MALLDIALNYASKGIAVFPIIEGTKKPACAWGDEATTDEAQIREWWTKRPKSNIGIAAAKSGLIIVDIDGAGHGKQGPKEWAKIARGKEAETLIVNTPSGGQHIYFRGELAASGTDAIAPGVDVKSGGGECGGYVLGIGSKIDGKGYYTVANKAEIASVPQWLKPYLTKPRVRDHVKAEADIELDTPAALRRAANYLKDAEPAVEGAGGDDHTFRVACNVLDFGVSIGAALELMCQHWNDRCSPPWDADELHEKLRRAVKYREYPVGIDSIDVDLEGIDPDEVIEAERPNFFRGVIRKHPSAIPPRRWLLGSSLMRKKVSVLLADPGQGKTSIALAMALAVVTGRGADFVGEEVHERCNVLLLNNEDEEEELDRRLAALMRHHDIEWDDLDGKLFPYSGVDQPFMVAKRAGRDNMKAAQDDWFFEKIRENKIGLVIVDPLVETHQADENDNVEMAFVGRQFRRIAEQTDAAVLVIHHTNKPSMASNEGYAGNMHRSRGASSVNGVARIVQTLYGMSEKDAERYGINPSLRHSYVRLDGAKANLSPRGGKERWFKAHSIILPNDDNVGVFVPEPLEEVGDVTASDLAGVLTPLLEDNLRVPLADAAEAVLADGWLGGSEKSAVMKQLETIFTTPTEVGGWKIWIDAALKGKKREKFVTGEKL